MDTGYFRSRQFAIAALVAALVLGAGAAAATWSGIAGTAFLRQEDACDAPAIAGAETHVERGVVSGRGGRDRTESFDAGAVDLASIDLCLGVGEVHVTASPDDRLHVRVHYRGENEEATERTRVEVRFTQDAAGLRAYAWQSAIGYASGLMESRSATRVRLEVQVPDGARPDARLATAVGDVRASGVMLGATTASTEVGDIRLLDVHLAGDLRARAGVGDVTAALVSVDTGTVDAAANVGQVDVRLPARADVGYDVRASSDVGDAEVRIGETETHRETSDGPGRRVDARSSGYDSKPTRVSVTASSNVGSVLVATA